MARIYFYKLTCDDGGAPCVESGVLSLAICKPRIRSTAEAGDIVLGFAAKSLFKDNRLIYIARVTKKLAGGAYYAKPKYSGRADNIYRRRNGRFKWRRGARYHGPEHLKHDLGNHPQYGHANVLLSTDFRYFGRGGSAEYRFRYPEVEEAIYKLGQGHRVNHSEKLRQQLVELAEEIFVSTRRKVLGNATTSPRPGMSHRSKSCGVVDLDVDC